MNSKGTISQQTKRLTKGDDVNHVGLKYIYADAPQTIRKYQTALCHDIINDKNVYLKLYIAGLFGRNYPEDQKRNNI